MCNSKYKFNLPFYCFVYGCLTTSFFPNVSPTEVTVINHILDDSISVTINVPVLMCHAKYTEYRKVVWYKDYKLLKSGSANFSDHILSVISLLNESSPDFNHVFKLQGYYWCETDYAGTTTVLDYLFAIPEIHTFVGRFLSTQDTLGDDDSELSLKERIKEKKRIYEEEMQEELFGFLPKPNTFVTDLKMLKTGLEVRFYLYARQVFTPRRPYANELIEDQHELEHILEYLYNNTEAVDSSVYEQILDWTSFRGINIKNIDLRSTLGCYQDVSLVPADPPREVTWPYTFLHDVVIPVDGCSSKNGLAVTRLCTGSFYIGARWGVPSGKCNMPPSKLTTELRDLYNAFGDETKPVYIDKLQQITGNPSPLTVTDLHIVADILTELSQVKELKLNEIDNMFTVFDYIAQTNSSELEAAKSTVKLTNRLLRVIDNILKLISVYDTGALISKQHMLLNAKSSKEVGENHVVGIAVLPPDDKETPINGSVEFLTNVATFPKHKSVAYFLLPTDLVIQRENETELPSKSHVNIVFFYDWLLFPDAKGLLHKRNYKLLPTPVMYASISGGPAWNLSNPVQLYFRDTFGKKIENPICVHYEPRLKIGDGDWSTEGCEYAGLKDGFYQCRCHHLSIFAIILSERPDTGYKEFHLGTAVYVGCGVSIIALSMTVLLYLLSKVWRSTVDHSILFWMALSFLWSLILLFISEMDFLWKPGCLLMAMLLNYTILVTLGWLLVQAVMHQLRFAKKTDIEEVPHFILKSVLSVWGAPIIIMIIIWLTKDYMYPQEENCGRTIADVSKAALIPIVVIICIILCVNLCATYAVTCRFKKDFLIGNSIYNDSVIKFRVACSIFLFYVLSWLFGFLALHQKSKELRILFSISITLTAYYVTLFFIFHEVSFWELCSKWKRKDNSEAEVVKFVAKDKENKEGIVH